MLFVRFIVFLIIYSTKMFCKQFSVKLEVPKCVLILYSIKQLKIIEFYWNVRYLKEEGSRVSECVLTKVTQAFLWVFNFISIVIVESLVEVDELIAYDVGTVGNSCHKLML